MSVADLADELTEMGSAATRATQDTLHEVGARASEYASQGQALASRYLAGAAHGIRRRPFTSVFTATACGVVAGVFIRSWMASRE